MARRSRRAGRDRGSITRRRSAPALSDFDDRWFRHIKEPMYNYRYIDLTKYSDRRAWHPSKREEWTRHPGPRGLRGRPRLIVVPQGHVLARHQTFGGKYSLRDMYNRIHYTKAGTSWDEEMERDEHGARRVYRNVQKWARVGFALPWQVIICVRRRRRREVLHALDVAGKRGVGAGKKQRRDEYSEIRC